jgi:hypothetical protein
MRKLVSSESPFEPRIGFSRAVYRTSESPTIRAEQLRENIRKPARDTRASSRGHRATVENVISAADKRASV